MDKDKADFEGNDFIQREDDGTKENSRKEDISQKEDYGGNGGIEEDGKRRHAVTVRGHLRNKRGYLRNESYLRQSRRHTI
jgi:hypothetical protein